LPDDPADLVAPGLFKMTNVPMDYPTLENQGFMVSPTFLATETGVGVGVADPESSVQKREMGLRQVRKVMDKPLPAVLSTHVLGDHWLGDQAMPALRG